MRRAWLAIVLCLGLLICTPALAEAPLNELGYYTVLDGTVYWVGSQKARIVMLDNEAEEIIIHGTVDGRPVTTDASTVLNQRDRQFAARRLTVEPGVTDLDFFVVDGWPFLTEITLPTTLSLMQLEIVNCPILETITFPYTVLGYGCEIYVVNCPKITALSFPEPLDAEGRVSVQLEQLPALESIYMSPGIWPLTLVGEFPSLKAFSANPAHDYYFTIDGVLYGQSDVRELIQYPAGKPDTHFDVPQGIEVVSPAAFQGAENLRSIGLPASVFTITGLSGCPALQRFDVAEDSPTYKAVDGVVYSRDGLLVCAYPEGKDDTYEVAAGTQGVIGAFFNNTTLKKLVLPEGFFNLENQAVYGCSALEEIVLPSTIDMIERDMLVECTSLRRWVMPQGNKHYRVAEGLLLSGDGQILDVPAAIGPELIIPEGATSFKERWYGYQVHGVKSVILPFSMVEYPALGLQGFHALESISVAEGHPAFVEKDGVLYSKDGSTLVCHPPQHGTYYDVLPGTERIGESAFIPGDMLQVVNFPTSLREIGGHAFEESIALGPLSLPLGLERIGESAFLSCLSLERIWLPDTLQTVAGFAFEGCRGLQEIYIPAHLKNVERMLGYDGAYFATIICDADAPAAALAQEGLRTWRAPDAVSVRTAEERWGVLLGGKDETVPVYAAATGEAGIIANIPAGSAAEILGNEKGFLRIRAGGQEGFAQADSVVAYKPLTQYDVMNAGMTAAKCSVYTVPVASGAPRTVLPEGSRVKLIKQVGSWHEIRTPEGMQGYAAAYDILPLRLPDEGYYWDKRMVIVREEQGLAIPVYRLPGEGEMEIARIYSGQQLSGTGKAEGWYLLKLEDGSYGFVQDSYVREIDNIYGNG